MAEPRGVVEPYGTAALLKELLRQAHIYLEAKIDLCPEEVLFDTPAGSTIASIGAIYAHAVLTEDEFIHRQFLRRIPLYLNNEWRARVDFPPKVPQDKAWTAGFRTDMRALREYARAVFAAGEGCLSGAGTDDRIPSHFVDLEDGRPVVVRKDVPLGVLFADNVILHTCEHSGEISALLGVRGLRGSRWG